jgi:hypothetical protein
MSDYETQLNEAEERILALQAQLVEAKSESDEANVCAMEWMDKATKLNIKLKEANKKLRWRKWPDEEPEISQLIIMYEERFLYLGDGQIQSSDGDLYMCDSGDEWLPLPTSNKEKT